MENQINLKMKNTPQLWVFLSANILFLCSMFFPAYFTKLANDFDIVFVVKTLGLLIAPLILFLLNGLLSPHQKAILVFWKISNPLPGSEAFSNISKTDTRIDREKLKISYGSFPKKPSEQNKMWYKIYKKNSSNLIVADSHRAFLLARDLTSLSFLFVLFIGLPICWSEKWPLSVYYLLILVVQYVLVRLGAKNRGRRFVANVLAIESNS
jgi:hypothetical protein